MKNNAANAVLETATKLVDLAAQSALFNTKGLTLMLYTAVDHELDYNECEDVLRYCTAK